MLYRLVILFLLGFGALPVRAETLKGRIVENEIRGRGLANVEILDEAQTTNPTTSDDWGRFSLDFPTKHAGEPVRIVVKREGYVVVNWEFLDLRLPASTKVDDVGTTLDRKRHAICMPPLILVPPPTREIRQQVLRQQTILTPGRKR
jgi:hypothetical protein